MRPEVRLSLLGALLAPFVASAGGVFQPEPSSNDNYGESYTFSADMDDGTFLQVQLSVTNLGPGSRHGICRATVKRPGEKQWTPQKRVGEKEWRYDAAEGVLRVDACSVRDTPAGVVVEAPLDKGLVRLAFDAASAPRAPDGSEVAVGDARYRHEVLVPFSAVTATVKLPGASEPELMEGGGYGDHTRSTVAPAKLARRWLRFRVLRGQTRLVLLAREGLDGRFGPVYLWREGSEPRTYERFELTRAGKKLQTTWQASLTDADGKLTVRSTGLLQRNAPVEDLGMLGGLVRPVVGSPVTYVLRGVLERPGQQPLDGLMEVSLDE
ncbi:hypothetical protein P2318_02325 [Myxococcaceae bacterium GXIMD 01537]